MNTTPKLLDKNSGLFWKNYYPQLVDLYIAAFSGLPWKMVLERDYVEKRLFDHFSRATTQILVSEKNKKIQGATWFDQPTFEELSKMRGDDIVKFLQTKLREEALEDYIWMRETLVSPQLQRQGVGSSLRSSFNQYVAQNYPEGVLVLTRHREDNTGIIKISTINGFHRTGVKQQANIDGQLIDNEFWYKIYK